MADSSDAPHHAELLALTAEIVEAHVTKNSVAADALPSVIRSVFGALSRADAGEVAGKPREPAVPVNRSIQRDYLVCLEDGAKVKILKRYLKRFGLTPGAYRAKWGLPARYPMVAPAYAERRSALAKQSGLGRVLRYKCCRPVRRLPLPQAPRQRKLQRLRRSAPLRSR